MKIHHLVKVHFDRRKPEITEEWLKHRYTFFMKNTLESLRCQTIPNWQLWLSFGVNTTTIDIDNASRRIRDNCPILWSHSDQHAPSDSVINRIPECDYVYVTRIDSDDLYAPDALEIAHSTLPQEMGRVEASMFRRGYLHDMRTGETGTYHGSSTPFHTMMIPRDVFCDPVKYAAIDYGDHSKVNSRYPTQVLPDWKFTVLVHGNNFISDMSYGRERIFGVEKDWSVDRFLKQPVVFDVDDFCDRWNCLPELDAIKERYPKFRCTLFTIPHKTSLELIAKCNNRDWIELAFHGSWHEPNEELKAIPPQNLKAIYEGILKNDWGYLKGFRPPGWYITPEHIEVLNELGMWVAIHERDERRLGPLCKHGYYVCRDKASHWHTSGEGQRANSVCHNGIREHLDEILVKWKPDQEFKTVGESILTIR